MLYEWILSAMLAWSPPNPCNVAQLRGYVAIASAIDSATDDPDEAALLASIAYYETGRTFNASPQLKGKAGERGPWQLMPWSPVPKTLDGQAKEALSRWKLQGPCGYTGEARNAKSVCPLAHHRMDRAASWAAQHPFRP